ncbi:AAA family ATPase [Lutispora sp.]|uniref:AAA family ATPase n=1 Tax=Lutispora sp. TaxID=2828727 RepID=UPI0035665F08
MIQNIQIQNIATYTNPVSINPRKINFFYGSNGSGKTTLSNFLGLDTFQDGCNVTWEDGRKLPVLVYNKKFVEDNFVENKTISGIFTLGQASKEAQEFISEQRKEANECAKLIETHTRSRDKVAQEIDKLTSDFEETCWTVQQKYGSKFSEALSGYRGSKKAFRIKCLQEYPNIDNDNPPVLKDIEQLYNIAFSKERETYLFYNEIDTEDVIKNEECTLLGKRISGSAETPIGTFIEFLHNSDWVKQGITYAAKSEGKCPYCQQVLPKVIQQDIEEFFDEVYKKECALIRDFERQYKSFTDALLSQLKNISDNPILLLDYILFKAEVEVLTALIDANKSNIQNKIAMPATKVNIDSIVPIVKRINTIIAGYNAEIKKNNNIVQNQSNEKERCQKLLWQYFACELRNSIQQYQKGFDGKMRGLNVITNKITEQSEKEIKHKKLIADKEETLTSVVPTVNAINGILKRFGFDGFELAENPSEKATYKIIRPDGSNAKKTLSEGEYNFVTFLYFYHLIYGSKDKTGIATDKVVVVDDPISSLDSNVLFIISTLVRTILNGCIDEDKGIKQVFIMTHNVYFHKEVSFLGSRKKYPTTYTAYWVVKKANNISDIIFYEENPIQTSYELLWAELKDVEYHQRVTLFNTLRRILEYYFNIIGGMDYEKCIDQFEGEDKIICKALISCINDGSHFISDDFVMSYESGTMENYIRVFKLIFENMGHGSHYRMMIGQAESILEAAYTSVD